MARYVNMNAFIDAFYEMRSDLDHLCTVSDYIKFLKSMSDAVEIVRCNDCIHRPIDTGGQGDGFDMEFPDNVCPCQVEDPYYSWVPKDDWFCPSGERKDDER